MTHEITIGVIGVESDGRVEVNVSTNVDMRGIDAAGVMFTALMQSVASILEQITEGMDDQEQALFKAILLLRAMQGDTASDLLSTLSKN